MLAHVLCRQCLETVQFWRGGAGVASWFLNATAGRSGWLVRASGRRTVPSQVHPSTTGMALSLLDGYNPRDHPQGWGSWLGLWW